MKLKFLSLIALAVANVCAHADTVALWDYSAATPTTKQTQSANGASFAVVGGVTTSFAGGVGGGTDQALNTTGYAAQNTGSLTQGVQFNIDTTGYTDLVLSFAQRNSNTASAWTELQYTVDGSTWLVATDFQMPAAQSTKFVTTGLTYDFSAVTDADNNPLFGVRMLAMFAPGTNAYLPTSGATYGSSGTIRYDNVLLTGDAMPDPTDPTSPVPEPHTYTLMLGGLLALGLIARRRRAN